MDTGTQFNIFIVLISLIRTSVCCMFKDDASNRCVTDNVNFVVISTNSSSNNTLYPDATNYSTVDAMTRVLKQQKLKEKNVLEAKLGWKHGTIDALRKMRYPGVAAYTRYAVARLGLSPLPNVKPLKPELGPVFNDVTSFRYPISIPSCRVVNGRRNIFIAAISAADNFEKRATIRETWAKDLNNVWNRTLTGFAGSAFILGGTQDKLIQEKIEEENAIHKDIIQIDMKDVYRNLPIKMAGLINWLYKKCANFKGFLLKVDDDVYISARTLEYFIHSHDPFSPSVYGKKYTCPAPPVRGKKLSNSHRI